MTHTKIGWQHPHLAVLGTPEIPLYLIVNQDSATLIEGGLSGMTDRVWQQLHSLLAPYGGIRHLRHWLITHSHYDHCSLLMTLKSRMPWVQVMGSIRTADALQRPSAIEVIRMLDDEASACYQPVPLADRHPLADVPLHVLLPTHALDIGQGMQIRAIPLPGHSVCQQGYYCEALGLLFVSDALGEWQGEGQWLPLVFQDVPAYRRSLACIDQLGAEQIALGHHAILQGPAARLAASQAMAKLHSMQEQALALDATPASQHRLAQQWTTQFGLRSAKVVSPKLHLQSMQRMIQLFRRNELEISV
ncbi:glyoxylase-like metal-dependent hydrolase (beta-lactamase superfamily II) [Chitinivorax tropicus]|uniref:Glyoxylase-like metal-dependent hydrolase (Beta-lactamase superfamily II) n=1 Tax=Chitinivorax tropicus TaxID=714531 RepID=A0A840MEB0_9PROT|nr:MBL fold metallo-hydrolase [Chitinivorax tropicus]MBB5017614.1 glyoxylase-like metal-dependent hydrolase (beta-lactamase superfamily II) [Chitinivorax tropicus]